MVTPSGNRSYDVLTGASLLFSAVAAGCAVTFYLSPKHGIAVFAAYSMMAGCVVSAIGALLGLGALVRGEERRWLALLSILASASLLTFLLAANWLS